MSDDDDDDERELLHLRLWVIGLALFVFSGFKSCTELKYWIWGRTAAARITRVHDTVDSTLAGRHVELIPKRAVHYTFNDADGQPRQEFEYLPADWPVPDSRTVEVEFLSGKKDASRIAGQPRSLWVYLFLTCVAGLAGLTWYLHREANRPTRSFAHERRLKRRRRAERRHKRWMS